ncbi:MAG: hypothetical protein QOH43_3102 [Solirubrobacteraceae bacterium]|jgi:hypothetical protein|nr:hypothetical protein [Solirubrobacteraceae bacterium]
METETAAGAEFMNATRSERQADDRHVMTEPVAPPTLLVPDAVLAIEPPSVPDGTFVKVVAADHPLPRACEVTVNFQDYHRSSSKLGRFGKIVGIDEAGGEYLVMLDNFECLAAPMRRVEWRKVAT